MANTKNLVKKIFERSGNEYPITFEIKNDELMVNATAMGKVFGENKKPQKFLRLIGVKSFINEMKKEKGADMSSSYVPEPYIVNGENVRPSLRGTWMHEKLAMRYAVWLSPSFHLWVINQIMELLKTGKVELNKPKIQQLQQHLNLQTQRDNTKDVSNRIYAETKGDVKQIPMYHSRAIKLIMGMNGKDLIDIAKINKVPKSVIRKGYKEIMRHSYPHLACCLSMVDNIIASSDNFRIDDQGILIDTVKKGEAMFDGLIKLGVIPKELRS